MAGNRSEVTGNTVVLVVLGAVVVALAYASGAVDRAVARIGAALQSSQILLAPGRGVIDVGPLGALDGPRIVAVVLAVVAVATVSRVLLRRRVTAALVDRGDRL